MIWAASFWDAYDVREQERAQQEHLDRFTALLGDAEAAAEVVITGPFIKILLHNHSINIK